MNTTPFEEPASIDCGPFHMIIGAMPKHWKPDHEAERLLEIVDNPQTRKFLPHLDFESKEEASEWLRELTMGWASKTKLPVILRLNDPLVTIGYVECYTPRSIDEKKDIWVIEYFLDKKIWGRGVMKAAVNNFLAHMEDKGVEEVRASTHRNNQRSIGLLDSLGFEFAGVAGENDNHVTKSVKLN